MVRLSAHFPGRQILHHIHTSDRPFIFPSLFPMLSYHLSFHQPSRRMLDLRLDIPHVTGPVLTLQLAAWRPGRYMLQHFAKNVRRMEAFGADGTALPLRKVTKDRWEIQTLGHADIAVQYEYYAFQMDAGGTYLDEAQLYVNWITCALAVVGREDEAYTLHLDLPEDWIVASALATDGHRLLATDYTQLTDSPLIASPTLQHYTTPCAEALLHVWIQGEHALDIERLLADFSAFGQVQRDFFGGFPLKDFHFLFQWLPYPHYHGVEHADSTVIVLGPGADLHQPDAYRQLLSISSHELFHLWNVKRLRPAGLTPYRYEAENYFEEGYVVEGVTTYYGDLLLARAGVTQEEELLAEFSEHLQRHGQQFGRLHCSLAAASMDLWLDGYVAGTPHRKVSIYTTGALVAWLIDWTLRAATDHAGSLDDLMRGLWQTHLRQPGGYTTQDFLAHASAVAGMDMTEFGTKYLYGTAAPEEALAQLAPMMGCRFVVVPAEDPAANLLGLQLRGGQVLLTAPGSPAEGLLAVGDEILSVNGSPAPFPWQSGPNLVQFVREGRRCEAVLMPDGLHYFGHYVVTAEWGEKAAKARQRWIMGR